MNCEDLDARLAEALSKADESDFPEELLRDWEPVECLGSSRLTETFLMRSRKDGTRAVAKLISPEKPESALADALKALSHPGLPRIISIWQNEKKSCVLREYIEGRPLSDSTPGFSEQETIRFGQKLCDILAYLHSRTIPVIHRDVKPENIILREDGTPVLIDFGIARLYSDSAHSDTRVMGTERFAPPEQYGFQQTDARSDLYSLGVTMLWMINGSVAGAPHSRIDNRKLRAVLNRCTAFAPDERYGSAIELKKALKRCERNAAVPAIIAVCAALLVLCAGIGLWRNRPAGISFAEPVIEQAVRQSLGVSGGTRLTRQMLESVEGLYIFGETVCADQDGFYAAADAWYAGGDRVYGSIASLEDVNQLPALTHVMLAAQQITDIAPLANLTGLVKIEFKHNGIEDISPLEGMENLASVGLNDNPVTDVSALQTLPNLQFLDLCDAYTFNTAVLEGLGDFEFLDITGRMESWAHLGSRSVRDLRLGWTGLSDLHAIAGVTGLERLGLEHTYIKSLDGIEAFPDLTYLRISWCPVKDLTPLLSMPQLQTLVVSGDMEPLVQALGETPFEVQYE